jgi:hypothetical protein
VSAGASASISGNFTNNGSVAGPTSATERLTFSNNVSAAGIYTGNIRFISGLSPGNNGPATTFLENFDFEQTTVLSLEIGGLTAGSEHDRLVFSGTGEIDGVLNVSLINGFQPVRGNMITLLDGAALIGAFDTINLPALSADLRWIYLQTPATVRLMVIPEPSTAVLVVMSGAVLLTTLRRKWNRTEMSGISTDPKRQSYLDKIAAVYFIWIMRFRKVY